MKPSLPVENSSLSHWQRTTRSFPYLHVNSLADVPISATYLIIGSGFSGALTAWELVKTGVEGKDILILEAKEAVSGASGRNAGHVRPDAFRGFPTYAAKHGSEQARKIIESEKLVLEKVAEFVAANKIDCGFHHTTTFDVCLSQEFANYQSKALDAYRNAGGDVSHVKFYEGQEVKTKTRIPDAICAYEWPAASNHPGKLCQWILSDVINKGVKLWTHCPATKITKREFSETSALRWDAHTPRGIIGAETVVHCTNAYAAYLIPRLERFISPRRSQCHSFVPPPSFSGGNIAKSTMSLRYGLENFFSFNQLKDGTIILGGTGTRAASDWDEEMLADSATFDDTGYSTCIEGNSRREFIDLTSANEYRKTPHGEGFDHVWAGILGMTLDSVPLIGSIDGLDGQWICAGFNGHGMARIFTCVPGLVGLMSGKSWSTTGLPECFRFSKERIDRDPKPRI